MQLGISFSPAGLLTPFHMGVRHALETFLYNPSTVPHSGASGGALAALTASLNVDPLVCLEACEMVNSRFSQGMNLRESLDPVIDMLLPEDAHTRLAARADEHKCTVSYYQVHPTLAPRFVQSFASREDLIDCARASCCVPLYFNGLSPVKVRGGYGVDGFFATGFDRLGTPTPWPTPPENEVSEPASVGAADEKGKEASDAPHVPFYELLSCPFPAQKVGLRLGRERGMVISPDLLAPLLLSIGHGDGHRTPDTESFLDAVKESALSAHASTDIDVARALALTLFDPSDRLSVALRPASVPLADKIVQRSDAFRDLFPSVKRDMSSPGTSAAAASVIYRAYFDQGALCARMACVSLSAHLKATD